jgi:hypothetical protein
LKVEIEKKNNQIREIDMKPKIKEIRKNNYKSHFSKQYNIEG